ncbi:MAG: response regulator [Bdellovibrionales bacterium]
MALRVLLADESSTIKKVFQLALQDYAVDVRPVNVGVDVVPVAQNFKPDIIFADVLLQKKSGYEVAAEVKQDPTLRGIPVVLMWSGFMELDEDKFQASHANAQLEKPFDVTALRKLVTELVPRTQNQRLSQFLSFPKMPEIEDGPPALETGPPPPPPPKADEDFTQVPIPKMKGSQGEKFRLNLKAEDLDSQELPVAYKVPAEKEEEILLDQDELIDGDGGDDADADQFAIRETRKPQHPPRPPSAPSARAAPPPPPPATTPSPQAVSAAPPPALSEAQLEKIIREQSAAVIESVVWKVVPDLAAQIIERELNRLLKERDSRTF